MTNLGVIAPIKEATEWFSAMVTAQKRWNGIWLCINSVHLNKTLLRPHNSVRTVEQVISKRNASTYFNAK